MAAHRPRAPCLLLTLLLMTVQVLSQSDFNLADAMEEDPQVTTVKSRTAAGGAGYEFTLGDLSPSLTTKAAASVTPQVPKSTRQPSKRKTKPAADDLDLADALNPVPGEKNKGQKGGFSDQDLEDLSKDSSYKPDKGSGGGSNRIDSSEDTNETTAEVGTIAGIVSAVAMALVGAVSSYISYQKKKLCFSIQQSLNAETNKNECPEGVVATEPQA